MNNKVSVIMSVYNGEKYLSESISSILRQTFNDFEFIIVDDCSDDASQRIISKFMKNDKRIMLISNDKNIGLTKSLNKAVKLASGKYIARQDADDISHPRRLESQVNRFDSSGNTSLCTGHVVYFYQESGKYRRKKKKFLRFKLLIGNPIIHGSVMFKKYDFDKVGGYDESLRYAQDYALWLKLIKLGRISIIDKFIYLQRIHDQSITEKNRTEQLWNTFAIQKKRFYDILKGLKKG